MFSSIASYIWGTGEEEEEEEVTGQLLEPKQQDVSSQGDQIEVDNEWIFIPSKNGEIRQPASCKLTLLHRTVSSTDDTSLGTTRQCSNAGLSKIDNKNRMDDASIEAPVRSQEQENEERQKGEERILEVVKQESQKPVGRRQILQKRQPLKDLNDKIALARKNDSPNNLRRNNMVHIRNHSTRKNKQYGRMESKHVGMVGKRAK